MPWSVGSRLTDLYYINENAEPLTMMFLEREDVYKIIKENPQILPYVSSNECLVLENVPVEDHKVDLMVVEAREGSSKQTAHLVFLKWFEYGSLMEDVDSFEEAYGLIGRELELLSCAATSISLLGSLRSGWARKLKKRVKSSLGIRRLVIGEVYVMVVVDVLTERFIQLINAVNDLVDPYIDALEITEYRRKDGTRIILTNLYTWR